MGVRAKLAFIGRGAMRNFLYVRLGFQPPPPPPLLIKCSKKQNFAHKLTVFGDFKEIVSKQNLC